MQRAPGQTLLALARRLLAASEIDRVIEPAIADLQHEWATSVRATALARLAIRTRAYAAVLTVVACHVVRDSVRASLTPPPWSITRRVLFFALALMITTTLSNALFSAHGIGQHWVFYAPDWILIQFGFGPHMWRFPLDPLSIEARQLPEPRASDIAKLATAFWAVGLLWALWVAPLIRQHYLAQVGLTGYSTTAVHQWLLPDLVAAIRMSSPSHAIVLELHRRLLLPAFAPIAAMLTWSSMRVRCHRSQSAATKFQIVSLCVLAALFSSTALAFGSFGQVVAQWTALLATALGAIGVLRVARVTTRRDQASEAHQ